MGLYNILSYALQQQVDVSRQSWFCIVRLYRGILLLYILETRPTSSMVCFA
jgi:hypothetical protein